MSATDTPGPHGSGEAELKKRATQESAAALRAPMDQVRLEVGFFECGSDTLQGANVCLGDAGGGD